MPSVRSPGKHVLHVHQLVSWRNWLKMGWAGLLSSVFVFHFILSDHFNGAEWGFSTSTEEHNVTRICLRFHVLIFSFDLMFCLQHCQHLCSRAPEKPPWSFPFQAHPSCPPCSFLVLPCLLLYRWKLGCFPSLWSFQIFTNDFWPQCSCK